MDYRKTGVHIAELRKAQGFTQESLAEELGVSPQAVSKWENGHSLPEAGLLPDLARMLDCTIDSLLLVHTFQVLDAVYGDGMENEHVTKRLNRMVDEGGLHMVVSAVTTGSDPAKGRKRYLAVQYRNEAGIFYFTAADGEDVHLGNRTESHILPGSGTDIIAAGYGNGMLSHDVTARIDYLKTLNIYEYKADHANFQSAPAADAPEYLTIVYLNDSGIHMATCAEGENLVLNDDRSGYIRQSVNDAESYIIPGVEQLSGFNRGMDCTWAGALTVALRAMGEKVTYETVMGVSGACWRIAFLRTMWDYSSVDALVVYDHATSGYRAFGYESGFADRVEKEDRVQERERILNSLRENRPVLGINLRVAHEWGVICGYTEGGTRLLCRTYFDDPVINSPDFENVPGTEETYLYVDNWPFIMTYFGAKGTVPSDRENLLRSLKVRQECMNLPETRNYTVGYDAYLAWQKDLRDDAWYKKADDVQFGRRLDVNRFCFMSLCDARRAAAGYLDSCTGLVKSGAVRKMAGIYREISEKLTMLLPELPALDDGFGKVAVKTGQMRKAWNNELRHRQADVLEEIGILEKRGEEAATVIIRELEAAV